jgi:hypothetical protein
MGSGPKPYPVIYDPITNTLQFPFDGSYLTVPISGSATIPNVVMATYSGSQTFQGADFTNFQSLTPTFSVTITPSSSTAKIKLSGHLFMQADLSNGSSIPTGRLSIWRDGVNLCPHSWICSIDFAPETLGGSTGFQSVSIPITWLDTPGDTNPHVYEIKVTAQTAGSEVIFMGASLDNVLIAEEVH